MLDTSLFEDGSGLVLEEANEGFRKGREGLFLRFENHECDDACGDVEGAAARLLRGRLRLDDPSFSLSLVIKAVAHTPASSVDPLRKGREMTDVEIELRPDKDFLLSEKLLGGAPRTGLRAADERAGPVSTES